MSEPRYNTQRIELSNVDDVRDVVHRAVACLAQGGVVVLPSETPLCLAANLLQTKAVERMLAASRVVPGEPPLILALQSPQAVYDWVPDISQLGSRLARKSWPGPIILQFEGVSLNEGLASRLPGEVRAKIAPKTAIAMWQPSHEIVREILRLTSAPIAFAPTLGMPDTLDLDPEIDLWIDDGAFNPVVPTLVQVEGNSWRVLRAGHVEETQIRRLAATHIVFVCAGNTCRSPMAEAYLKDSLCGQFDCRPAELKDRGYIVESAGLSASSGESAADAAIELCHGKGGGLLDHRSQRLSRELASRADWIVTMTYDQREAILSAQPMLVDRVLMLDPEEHDIDDPFGRGKNVYLSTSRAISEHVRGLLKRIEPQGH